MKTILYSFLSLLLLISLDTMSQCEPSTAITVLDGNNVSANLLAGGDVWGDINSFKYEVPTGSGINAFFTGSIWMGGLDDEGGIHLASQQYRQVGHDYFTGPLDENGNTYEETCMDFDRHWKVTKTMIDEFKNGNGGVIDEAILTWPGKGNPNGYGIRNNLAPFIDVNNDGIYNAEDGDYPNILGDQAVWWVINDVGNLHTNSGGAQIGVEIHVMAYAYASNDVLNNTTFYNYTILNKSGESYYDFYIGIFSDPELGNPIDDYIGCNKELELAFTYNGDDFDENITTFLGYGSTLPVVGTKVLQNPKNQNGYEMPLSSFGYMINYDNVEERGDPHLAHEYYYRLKGNWNDGSPYTVGGDGFETSTDSTKFVFPGNPSDGAHWSECSESLIPGDRRFLQSFGPMQLKPFVPVTFTYAAIWSQDPSFEGTCPDLTPFFNSAEQVQAFHDSTHCKRFDVSISGSLNTAMQQIDVSTEGHNAGELYYQWSDGSTEKQLEFLEAGIYTLTVSNDFGCSKSAEFDVNALAITSLNQLEVNVYPNPSTNGLFNISGTNENLSVSVFDVLGNQVLETSMTSSLDLSHQPSGMYFVRLSDGQSSQVVRLMIAD